MQMFYWWQLRLLIEVDWVMLKPEDIWIKLEGAFGDLNHDISASGAALTDFILTERKIELVGEGHRLI
jgi:hypothetical protein